MPKKTVLPLIGWRLVLQAGMKAKAAPPHRMRSGSLDVFGCAATAEEEWEKPMEEEGPRKNFITIHYIYHICITFNDKTLVLLKDV